MFGLENGYYAGSTEIGYISGAITVGFVVFFAWKTKFFAAQWQLANSQPAGLSFFKFFKIMVFGSKSFIVRYLKMYCGYFLRFAWYFIIFLSLYSASDDLGLTVVIIGAIVLSRFGMLSSEIGKLSGPVVLTPDELERIKKGSAKVEDFA